MTTSDSFARLQPHDNPKGSDSRHTENFQEFLCGNPLVSTKLQRPHGSYSAMGKWVKRENFGAGPVSPSSGKVQTVLFPSRGKRSIWEGDSSPRWDFASNGISLSLNGILLWFHLSSNKQKAHRFTLGLCSHVQTAWGPS